MSLAPRRVPPIEAMMAPNPRAAETAANLVLAGLVIQAGQVALGVVASIYLSSGGFLHSILFYLAVIGGVWLVLAYLFSYRRLAKGELALARVPTFVFALASLLTLGVVAGICFILAYHEIGVAQTRPGAPGVSPPPVPLRTGSKVCAVCGLANPLSSVVCQACGILLGR